MNTPQTENGQWNEQARFLFLKQAEFMSVAAQAQAYRISKSTCQSYRTKFRRLAGIPSLAPWANGSQWRGANGQTGPIEGEDFGFSTGAKNPAPNATNVAQEIRDLVNRLSRTEAERDAAKNQVEIFSRKLSTIRAALGE